MKKLFSVTTIIGLFIAIIGASFADSELMAFPISIIATGLAITVVSLIASQKGEKS